VQELQFIECVAERDIDLLLPEEFHVSASFRSWLIGQAFELDFCCGQFFGARHSVNHITLGESDLVVLFADGAGNRIALLIENKIDALASVPLGGARFCDPSGIDIRGVTFPGVCALLRPPANLCDRSAVERHPGGMTDISR